MLMKYPKVVSMEKRKENAMSKVKISNKIFDLQLTAHEITVYAYLCSLPSLQDTLTGETTVSVKQSTIAQKCGIKAVQTVAKVITLLAEKSLVTPLKRSMKRNGHKGTYIYIVKKLPTEDSFFFVERSVFGQLVPRQMMIYLFICKSFSMQLRDSWNSFNDIAAQTGMKRETVIATVSELERLNYIRKGKRKARDNRRVFVDNHYFLIIYVKGSIRKNGKKVARLYRKYNRAGLLLKKSIKFNSHVNTKCEICQALFENFFERGSPKN